jgi:ribosome maturation factor RimP
MDLKKQIEEMVRPTIERAGYEFKKVEIKQKGRAKELIITIDKGGKLSVEDCAKVSRMIDPIIEKADLIRGRYFLIVSSPGIG